jgi:hypothetical protein
MDIYSAEKQLNKVVAYLTDLEQTKQKSSMYSCTRSRLERIGSLCKRASTTVDSLLNLNVNISRNPIIADVRHVSNAPISTGQLTRKQRSYVLHRYSEAISSLNCIDSESISICISLLQRWFNVRFMTFSKNFYYNIGKIPMWIRNIVLVYGRSIELNQQSSFVTEFTDWCNNVGGPGKQYAVPYSVHSLESSLDSSDVDLISVVIWDILYDGGLNSLSNEDIQLCNLGLSATAIYDLCDEINPAVLDNYRHYSSDSSILSCCKLV